MSPNDISLWSILKTINIYIWYKIFEHRSFLYPGTVYHVADRQKVKTDLLQLLPTDGVHSPHGQTNFLPPQKERFSYGLKINSPSQRKWFTTVMNPCFLTFSTCFEESNSSNDLDILSLHRTELTFLVRSLVTHYEVPQFTWYSEEYWFPKPMSIFINKLIYLWRMKMNFRKPKA